MAHESCSSRRLGDVREVDTLLEPLARRQAPASADVTYVRAVVGRESDLWLEPAGTEKLAHSREARVNLASLDPGDGGLSDPGSLTQLGLGETCSRPREIDEVATVHLATLAQICHISTLPPVDLSPVRDPGDEDEALRVVDRVDDPVVAHSDPKVVAARELDSPGWARIDGEPVDRVLDPLAQSAPQPPERSHRLRTKPYLVHGGLLVVPADFAPRHGGLGLVARL